MKLYTKEQAVTSLYFLKINEIFVNINLFVFVCSEQKRKHKFDFNFEMSALSEFSLPKRIFVSNKIFIFSKST